MLWTSAEWKSVINVWLKQMKEEGEAMDEGEIKDFHEGNSGEGDDNEGPC